ncbi:hypothetical protein BS50DRAFT_227299 [Corynespora cassiicola Philippines]|uniref:Cora-domain-containing protein n=1 Tax=Corynespora cassiicola Philippines TaxID=1448308 RepID=A0A2T2N2F2_CORCC|nr:hypothetical protein BS50DRAFT_227299 [Corynespora cassiicola Philippines]
MAPAATNEKKGLHGAGKENKRASTATTAVSPSPIPDDDSQGSTSAWLCDEGEYRKYIDLLSGSNPGLTTCDPNNVDTDGNVHVLKRGNACVSMLESPATGQPRFKKTTFRHSDDLRKHFSPSNYVKDGLRRIYIMEGLAPDYIAILGGHFFMEPTFFLRQERTCVWSNDFTPTSDALPLPALLQPDRAFHLQYCELRSFNKAIENRYHFCKRTRRHVGMTPARHKEDSTTGILRRKVSWWSRPTENGGWDAVILCDPPLRELSPSPKQMTSSGPKDIPDDDELKNMPFQNGYIDFLPYTDPKRALRIERHQHGSMLQDLVHYFENHSDLLSAELWKEPSTSSIFLKKIVAAQNMQLVDYIKAMLPSLELKLTTAWIDEQDQWKSLQTISRRCGNYRDDVEDTLLSLCFPLEGGKSRGNVNWWECERDFQYIYHRLGILKGRADTLMQSMTGLASIAGNRQNLEEAKRVKRLNLLALLFIPLAYTSSLFSMQDSYAPGNGQFWVYWVSALGVVAMTVAVTWIMDSALDDAAQWQLGPLRFLKFWDQANRPNGLKRQGTIFGPMR